MSASLSPILVVEDSPDDRIAIVRALRKAGCEHPVQECQDGDEALHYLRSHVTDQCHTGENHSAGHPSVSHRSAGQPALVLLDLNMPRVDGISVLKEIKSDPDLQRIPVIILTTSRAPQDIARSYAAGANCYVQKPVGAGDFTATIARLVEFWFSAAILPHGAPHPQPKRGPDGPSGHTPS